MSRSKNPFMPKAPASAPAATSGKGVMAAGFAKSKGAPPSKPGVKSLPKLGSKARVPQMGKVKR